jgi:hypothetical protein
LSHQKVTVGFILIFLGISSISQSIITADDAYLPPLNDNWLYVGGSGPGNYTSIQNAIDNASVGDTVFVYSGTYEGYVVINKAIHLIGEVKNTTSIIGYFAYTISLVTDGIEMRGFTILNNASRGEGVRIDSSYNIFTDNIIDIPNDRIRLFGSNNTFSANTIKNTYLYISGDDNIISDNTFINYLYEPLTNGLYGIYFMDCWNNNVSHNSFYNAGLYISLENVCNNVVT